LGPVQTQWLGFRPSLPDSLPVIGRGRRCQNLIHAFGHGHLGMTLAGARVYAFDTPAAQSAARLLAYAKAQGLGLHQIPSKLVDLQIAGIAAAYGLAVATRNVGDFKGLGLALVNPWQEPTPTAQ
jgi:hypothetical protein